MYWYYTFIDLLVIAFIALMARHLIWRGRYFLHIFQLEGYKFGEYWQWLKDNWNDRVITPEHALFTIIIFALFAGLSDTLTGSAAKLVIIIFGFFWFGPVRRYRQEREKKPLVYTPRMLRLLIPFGILSLLLPFTGTQLAYVRITFDADIYLLAFSWIVGDILLPFLLFIAAGLTYPIEKMIHRNFKRQARKKLEGMPNLKVVAITGSYGKTSTKFMIRDLLKERYRVCATPGSYNTPMGICKVINNDLQARHQVLVLEMGARYKGNIRELCQIAPPDIAVVTNVGLAHLETFGSQEAIAQTKSEIVQHMKPGGTAVLNGDDPLVSQMAEIRDDIKVVKTGLKNGEIQGSNIQYDVQGTTFSIHLDGTEQDRVNMKLLGVHNVQNMIQAMAVGSLFGLRLKTMAVAAGKVEPVEHRLEMKKEGELYVIDDAFNSNPTGARNAVEILSQFKSGRRIIVTPGMVELGEIQDEENKKFGRIIGEANLDLVILVGAQQTQPIKAGIRETGFDSEKIKIVKSLFKANDLIRDYAQSGDVILYENDLPDTYNE